MAKKNTSQVLSIDMFWYSDIEKEDYYKVFGQCGDVMTSAFNYLNNN